MTRAPSNFGRNAGYVAPVVEATTPQRTNVGRRQGMATEAEMIVHHGENGLKSLRMRRGLEPTHASFTQSRRLMRVLCPIVGTLVSDMGRAAYEFSTGRRVARQLIRHHKPWGVT